MDWQALAREVVAARVALGYQTREAFAKVVGLSTRTLGDIERARRTSMDQATLAKVEQALGWPTGRTRTILDGAELEKSWLSTREGVARHLHRDDLPLVELLYRSGLNDTDKFRLILHIRAAREAELRRLLEDVAGRIRTQGGWAPDRAYPPLWLVENAPDG